MAKTKNRTAFVCQNCGTQRSKWEGRCSDCGAWNSLVEEKPMATPQGWLSQTVAAGSARTVTLDQEMTAESLTRIASKIGELDRVLGGGLVPGSFVLLGGDPGIGKSTLLLQAVDSWATDRTKVFYASGEESTQQTALRAQRLGVRNKNVHIGSESQLEEILKIVDEVKPSIVVVDSIQTIFWPELGSAPGTVSQVRECAARLMALAKNQNISVILVGHVTKDGNLAGPKTLEHMVDTVLSFEGDNHYQYRLLRSIKNRFGPANEMGVFSMDSTGLKEVANPSELFLQERTSQPMGSAVFAAMEGSRPLLCEIQALTASSPMVNPRRTSLGVDVNRVHLLAAVLDKFLNIQLAQNDIFVNVVGGLKIQDPAVDLAVAVALVSTMQRKELANDLCVFGEIGLTGEVRPVAHVESRLQEARKLGFKHFVLPAGNQKQIKEPNDNIHFIKNLRDLIRSIEKTRSV